MGQAFFPGARSALEGTGVSNGVADGVSSGSGVGVGLASFRFDLLFGVGVGVGVPFFRRDETVGDGVGVPFFAELFRCLWDGVGVGVGARIFLIFLPSDSSAADAASTAPNKITNIRTHFITRCCSVRCPERRFEPNSSDGCGATVVRSPGRMPTGPQRQDVCATIAPALAGLLCSNECRPRNFREENSR